jgi:ABC-type microcin C transport system duplicated ATPase subunit YejF
MPLRKKIQMIFQDPFSSLNPRMTSQKIISEPLEIHFKGMSKNDRIDRVAQLLTRVGLKPDFIS